MMSIQTILTGTKSLLMHNIQLANPDNEWARKISAITKKRKKTEDDRRDLALVEWQGSLYTHDNQIVIPTGNVLKSFKEAAKVTKEGKQITRALVPRDIHVPLIFPGDAQTPETLMKIESYRDQTLVGVGTQRVVRTRPIFRTWGLIVEWELLTEVMDYDNFVKIAKMAGKIEGLGDNRSNGFGRYTVEIKEIAAMQEAA